MATMCRDYQQFGARDDQQLFFLIKKCIQILSFDPYNLVKVRYSRVFIITGIDLWNNLNWEKWAPPCEQTGGGRREEVNSPIQGGDHFSIRERESELKYSFCHTFLGSFVTIVYIIKERILTLGEFSCLLFQCASLIQRDLFSFPFFS